jgi:hypothetical protein
MPGSSVAQREDAGLLSGLDEKGLPKRQDRKNRPRSNRQATKDDGLPTGSGNLLTRPLMQFCGPKAAKTLSRMNPWGRSEASR